MLPSTRLRATVLATLLSCALVGCGGGTKAPAKKAAPAPGASPSVSRSPGPVPVFSHGKRDGPKRVALTFDADMTAGQRERAAHGERFDNPALIGTLRRLKVPATVFMTGAWADQYPAEAKSLGADPLFEVGNHSYTHHAFSTPCYGLPAVAPGTARADVERAFDAFRRAGVAHTVPYFRFPGGCHTDAVLRELGPTRVTAVQWDVVSGDAFAGRAGPVAAEVLDKVGPGSVVVMHCTRSAAPATEEAVRRIVPELRARGYALVRVSELIAG